MNDEKEKTRSLLDYAITNYKAACCIYELKNDDEGFLNVVGYHLQQTIELALKHNLEMNGIEYPKTHDINVLIEKSKNLFQNENLEMLAPKITEFATIARYDKNFLASVRILEKTFKEAKNILEFMKNQDLENQKIGEKQTAEFKTV